MKIVIIALAVTLSLGAVSNPAVSGVRGNASQATDEALIRRELADRTLDYRLAPIRSAQDLQAYLRRMRNDDALSLLSAGGRKRFLQSLVFTDKGLASFDYRDIRAEMSASQIYRLLSLFGAQRSTKSIPGLHVSSPADEAVSNSGVSLDSDVSMETDYKDYWCETRATCRPSIGSICVGSNC